MLDEDLFINDEEFVNSMAIWVSKKRALDGFEILILEGGGYDAAVYDYGDPGIRYLNSKGPYKTYKGAFGAIGAALDKIERIDREILEEREAESRKGE